MEPSNAKQISQRPVSPPDPKGSHAGIDNTGPGEESSLWDSWMELPKWVRLTTMATAVGLASLGLWRALNWWSDQGRSRPRSSLPRQGEPLRMRSPSRGLRFELGNRKKGYGGKAEIWTRGGSFSIRKGEGFDVTIYRFKSDNQEPHKRAEGKDIIELPVGEKFVALADGDIVRFNNSFYEFSVKDKEGQLMRVLHWTESDKFIVRHSKRSARLVVPLTPVTQESARPVPGNGAGKGRIVLTGWEELPDRAIDHSLIERALRRRSAAGIYDAHDMDIRSIETTSDLLTYLEEQGRADAVLDALQERHPGTPIAEIGVEAVMAESFIQIAERHERSPIVRRNVVYQTIRRGLNSSGSGPAEGSHETVGKRRARERERRAEQQRRRAERDVMRRGR